MTLYHEDWLRRAKNAAFAQIELARIEQDAQQLRADCSALQRKPRPAAGGAAYIGGDAWQLQYRSRALQRDLERVRSTLADDDFSTRSQVEATKRLVMAATAKMKLM